MRTPGIAAVPERQLKCLTKRCSDRLNPPHLLGGGITTIADLGDFLRHLRLHRFALVHYSGDVLAKAVDAPTEGCSWRDNLERFAHINAQGAQENAFLMAQASELSLFDLNKAGDAGVVVAKVISESTCKG